MKKVQGVWTDRNEPAADDGLSVRRQRGRHDKKRSPSGWKHEGGWLSPDFSKSPPTPVMTEDDRKLIGQVRDGCNQLLDPPEGSGRTKMTGITTEQRRSMLRTFEDLYGHPYGQDWQLHLAQLIRTELVGREVRRQRQERGEPPIKRVRMGDRSAAELLDALKKLAKDPIPPEITPKLISTALEDANLGGAGGAGKKGALGPFGAVERLARTIATSRVRKTTAET